MNRCFPFLLLLPALAMTEETELPRMGAEWLARVKDPATRMDALYELEKVNSGKNPVPDPEEFAARNARVSVSPCPQPGNPDALAIINITDWRKTGTFLFGIDEDDFPPHPLETERRLNWKKGPLLLKPWKPDEPWIESISGFLVDGSGNQIAEGFYGSPGIIADFNSDGMLDLLEISRLHLDHPERLVTCVSIGPLDDGQPRDMMLYCDFRGGGIAPPKSATLSVRQGKTEKMELVVSTPKKEQKETAFAFNGKNFEPVTGEIPEGMLLDHPSDPNTYAASKKFLKSHGMEFSGTGSDDMDELLTEFVPPAFPEIGWSAPESTGSPRSIALEWVSSHFPPNRKNGFEVASLGDPVAIPETGWIELFDNVGGWGEESVCVHWLKKDGAEEWAQVDADHFVLTKIPAPMVALEIATVTEIGLVRTVPKSPFSARIDSDQDSADDYPSDRVRAMRVSPQRVASVFESTQTGNWKLENTGNAYDRQLAATAAVHFFPKPLIEGEVHPVRTMAAEWLDPEKVENVPPALARVAIESIGRNKWEEHFPLLKKLEIALGEPNPDERKLAELERAIRAPAENKGPVTAREDYLAHRKLNAMKAERIALVEKLTGTPGYELRDALAEAIAAF